MADWAVACECSSGAVAKRCSVIRGSFGDSPGSSSLGCWSGCGRGKVAKRLRGPKANLGEITFFEQNDSSVLQLKCYYFAWLVRL